MGLMRKFIIGLLISMASFIGIGAGSVIGADAAGAICTGWNCSYTVQVWGKTPSCGMKWDWQRNQWYKECKTWWGTTTRQYVPAGCDWWITYDGLIILRCPDY